MRDQHQLSHTWFISKSQKGSLQHAGVLVVADVVLDAGALALATLEHGDVLVRLVGEQNLEAVPVMVCEGELGARVRALAPDISREPEGHEERSRDR